MHGILAEQWENILKRFDGINLNDNVDTPVFAIIVVFGFCASQTALTLIKFIEKDYLQYPMCTILKYISYMMFLVVLI
jgi:hypothetical protein